MVVKRRFFCVLLALILCAGMLPAAMAAEAPSQTEPVTEASAPVVTETPPETEQPGEDGETPVEPESLAEPSETEAPAETELPAETEQPAATQTPADTTQTTEELLAAAAFDGEGESTTITLGQPVTSTADNQVYFINLAAGLYYIRTEGGSFTILPPNAQEDQGVTKTGGAMVANEAGNYEITVASANTTFKFINVADATETEVPSLPTGEEITVNNEVVYKLGAGTYSVDRKEIDISVFTTAGKDRNAPMGSNLEVPNGKTYWLVLKPIGAGGEHSLTLKKAQEFVAGTETPVKNGYYKTALSKGLYVLEYSGCSVSYTIGMGVGSLFSANGKQYLACTGSASLAINVTSAQTGAQTGAKIKVRAMVDSSDTTLMTETDGAYTVSGSGDDYKLYRFVAPEAGYYTVTKQGMQQVYDANGDTLRNDYATLSKGEVLYVPVSQNDASCTICKGEIKTLTCDGQTATEIIVKKSDGTVCYRFDVPETAVYCFGGSRVTLTTSLGSDYTDSNGLRGGMIEGYAYIELTAGQTVYFYIGFAQTEPGGTEESSRTVKFGTAAQMHQPLSIGRTYQPDDVYQGYTFTPEVGGLYIINAPGDGNMLKMLDLESLEDIRVGSATSYNTLEGGRTYYLSIPKTRTLKITPMGPEVATPLELDKKQTSSDVSAIYSYEVTESGFYTLTCESTGSVSQYDTTGGLTELPKPVGQGGGMGGGQPSSARDEYTVALEEGTTVYFILKKPGANEERPGGNSQGTASESMGVTLSKRTFSDSDKKITTGKHEKGNDIGAGVYLFTAPESGMYVLSGAEASVVATGNANIKKGTTTLPVLFYLKKDQTAYINVGSIDGFLELYLLGDEGSSITLKTLAEEKSEVLAEDTVYSFTAETDGLYLVEVPEGGGVLDFVHFLDNHMRQRMMIQNRIHRSFVCNLEAGETVYVLGQTRIKGGDTPMNPSEDDPVMDESPENKNATVIVTNVSVAQALDAIDLDQSRGLNAADTREAVQELGADYLTDALNSGEGAAVVDKMNAVESNVDDSTVTTTVADNAGVETVTIIGARLNDLTEENKTVTLTVAADKTERALPEELDADSAVYLTINLDGVESTSKLAVPVCLTVAVPADMDAQSVRLVHYGADKTELLDPIDVYEADGTWYARFAVGGFSPFALAETATSSSGGNASSSGSAKGQSPKTGDEAHMALWSVLATVSVAAVALAVRKRKVR